MSTPNDAVDAEVLADLRELMQENGDDGPFLEIIDLFFGDSPQHLKYMRQAIEQADAHHLKQAAHNLKGSSGNLGAVKMAQLCTALEEKGRAGSVHGADQLLTQLEAEYLRVKQSLEAAKHR